MDRIGRVLCITAKRGHRCPSWVTNGCADNVSGTSEVPQLVLGDPLCATRKSVEVGQKATSASSVRRPVISLDFRRRQRKLVQSSR
jgi:hypothetical protein